MTCKNIINCCVNRIKIESRYIQENTETVRMVLDVIGSYLALFDIPEINTYNYYEYTIFYTNLIDLIISYLKPKYNKDTLDTAMPFLVSLIWIFFTSRLKGH